MIKLIDTYSDGAFTPEVWKAQGYTGVIMKAGQGQLADVPRVHPEWQQQARAAGLMTGWYWLSDSRYKSADHIKEMQRVNLFADLGELGLWLDIEKPVISMSDARYWLTPYAGYKNVVDLFYLLGLQNVKAGTYTGPGAYELIFRGAPQSVHDYMATHDLWSAQYPYIYIPGISKPTLYGSWKTWILWQYREGPDVNIFNGTDEEFYGHFNSAPIIIPPDPIPPETNGGFSMKGTAHALTNIKPMSGGNTIAQLQVGDYAYGNVGPTDLTDFTHFYRANGTIVQLGNPTPIKCKAWKDNLTITNETEGTVAPPPTTLIKTHTVDIYNDGSLVIDGEPYP